MLLPTRLMASLAKFIRVPVVGLPPSPSPKNLPKSDFSFSRKVDSPSPNNRS